jgi:hypothetical protein
MTTPNLPGDLPEDFSRLEQLIHQAALKGIEIASTSERHLFFQALRDLIHEKDMAGDHIAVDTLNWAYEQIADRVPLQHLRDKNH